jgi:hypothetical protein
VPAFRSFLKEQILYFFRGREERKREGEERESSQTPMKFTATPIV